MHTWTNNSLILLKMQRDWQDGWIYKAHGRHEMLLWYKLADISVNV